MILRDIEERFISRACFLSGTLCLFAEYKFSMYTPSMIAAASVAAALHGLDWTGKSGYGLAGLLDELTRITAIEQVSYQNCVLHSVRLKKKNKRNFHYKMLRALIDEWTRSRALRALQHTVADKNYRYRLSIFVKKIFSER